MNKHGRSISRIDLPGFPVMAVSLIIAVIAVPQASFAVTATQNLVEDPYGRIVDVVFDEPLAVTEPWDRFRFNVNVVQPLARDGGAFLGDLTGDGTLDLLLVSFDMELLLFPGIPDRTTLFGDAMYVQRRWDFTPYNPFSFNGGNFMLGDVEDLDGDGKKDVVLGWEVLENVGTPEAPVLERVYDLFAGMGGWDPVASTGDLNGDGKPDVLITYNYGDGTYIAWNNSTPGVFDFTVESFIPSFVNQGDNRLTMGDLNGDGLLDLVGAAGIYYNMGTAQASSFDFDNPSPWNVTGGPSWLYNGQGGTDIFLVDTNQDGLLDAYVSNIADTTWQVFFYLNEGTPDAHALTYKGPVLTRGSPVNVIHRGTTVSVFGGHRAYVATGDVDGNAQDDILISNGGSFPNPTILWNFTESPSTPVWAYQDLYTYPDLSRIGPYCGQGFFDVDVLCYPPDLFVAWTDLSGDGLSDALRGEDPGSAQFQYFRMDRTGSMPFSLDPEQALTVFGLGAAVMDLDLDGNRDLVTGTATGNLRFYRNTSTDDTFSTFASPVYLSDGGIAITLGGETDAWPAPFDLDGDGDLDLLVASHEGYIHKVICYAAGDVRGFRREGLLATQEWDPIDLVDTTGSNVKTPSLTVVDADSDGLDDVVIGDDAGKVWLLHNVGTITSPVFSMGPMLASRTAAAYLEVLSSDSVRLRFGVPTMACDTDLYFYDVPTAGAPLTGKVTITRSVLDLAADGHKITSDSCVLGGGDSNGAVEPGEKISLTVPLINRGAATVSRIFATLSSPTSGVVITQGNSDYPDLAVNESREGFSEFRFTTVPEFVSCGASLEFDLAISTDCGSLDDRLTISIPVDCIPCSDAVQLDLSKNTLVLDECSMGTGGGNAVIDPGETITLAIELTNRGLVSARNIAASLSCNTAGVTILNGASSFPDLAKGSTASCLTNFSFRIDPNVLACDSSLDFDLAVDFDGASSSYTFQLVIPAVCTPCFAPDLDFVSHTVVSDACALGAGDSNTVFEPGETATISITLKNQGFAAATTVLAALSSPDPGVTVLQNTSDYPDIGIGEEQPSLSDYSVRLDPARVFCGSVLDFELAVDFTGGQSTVGFQLAIPSPCTTCAQQECSNGFPGRIADLILERKGGDVELCWNPDVNAQGGYHIYQSDEKTDASQMNLANPLYVPILLADPAQLSVTFPEGVRVGLTYYQVVGVCVDGISEGPN